VGSLHILVSVLNIVAAASFAAGYILHLPYALLGGEIGGILANGLAVLIGIVVLVMIAVKAPSGGARGTLRNSWLGLVNAAVVIVAWSIVIATGALGT
jgi:hypothetical protein